MTILVLCWHPGSTNISTAGGFKRFYEILKRADKKNKVLVIDKYPSLYTNLTSENVTIFQYGKGLKFNWYTDRFISVFLLLQKSLGLKIRPEIIYVPFSELPQLSLTAVILKFIFKSRLVFCNLNVNTFKIDKILNRFLHGFSNRVISLSSSLKTDLENSGIKVSDLNGVGFDMPISQKSTPKKIYDAVFIGRHTPEKGFFDLLEIWNILVNKLSHPLSLITIGDTPEIYHNQIYSFIKHHNLDKYIHILGNVIDSEKYRLFDQSRICVFPSLHEGWGIVPMEALSRHLPTIAYDLPVYRESISKTQAFITVPKGDTSQFALGVISSLKNLSQLTKATFLWKPDVAWDVVATLEWSLICKI